MENPRWIPRTRCFSPSLAKGVGKTRVIRAVELGFELLRQKEEVFLLAPTGEAAYNIGGRTIHTALSIDVCDRRPRPSVGRSTHCGKGGQYCLSSMNSTVILGALPIVVLMGDFHQFAPIKAQPNEPPLDS
jgi:hypothetical protein